MPVPGREEPVIIEDLISSNYEYFIKAPPGKGVRLALHPDDPPVPVLSGVALRRR
jgi:mannonate dehydratase